jgi:ESX secretion system protein EccD
MDLSLPADVPLAHLLPPLLQAAGPELADAGLAHSGWVLQRLDEAPFDTSLTLSACGVRDGEVLFFRPQMAQFPEVAFDDVADVIATGINERTDRWRPETTRRFGQLSAAALLVVGVVGLALSGPDWLVPAIAAGTAAAVLLIMGIVLSRAVGDAGTGAVLGFCALPYAFLAGLLAPATSMELIDLEALHVLSACGALTAAAVVAGFAIAEGLPTFLGIGVASLLGVVGAGCVEAFGAPPAGVAALTAAICLSLTAWIPSLSFKLARLPLPPVPANADELRSAAQVFDGPTVLRRTGEADRFATGLVAGVGLVAIVTHLFLVFADDWLAVTMSLALTVVLLLRARVFHGRAQRLWMLCAGLAGPALLGVRFAIYGSPMETMLLVVLPGALAVTVMVTLALWLPSHKPSPFWGRAGDLLDLMLIIALIPLALGLLELYAWLRGLSG